jgi:Trypsin-like peptidase domain
MPHMSRIAPAGYRFGPRSSLLDGSRMFANALDKARLFTHPLIQSVRYYDGTTESGLLACVILNPDGWFLTVAHVLNAFMAEQQHAMEILGYENQLAAIKADPKLNSGQRHKAIRKLKVNPKWVTNQSTVGFMHGSIVQIADWSASGDIDLAVARIVGFNPAWVTTYPVFKKPANLMQGTSLCRLGYPFIPLVSSFDQSTKMFNVGVGSTPFFANEGIYARELIVGPSPNGPFAIRFIETSSPGLRGQSGGPVFDGNGLVCGIQANTASYDLAFNSNLKIQSGKSVEVYQFLNVGRAIHPQTIHEFLTQVQVQFQSEP